MSNTTVTIAGKEYVYQGVTDLEVAPLAEVFGTERPEEGTKEYRDWERQFMRRFADYSSQRAIAYFLLCAFPSLPESVVKYTVRRMPDGTEECKPGRDLRVKLEAKDFEQIVLIISSELKKIEWQQKLTQKQSYNSKDVRFHAKDLSATGTHDVKSMTPDNRAISHNVKQHEAELEPFLSFEEFKRKKLMDDIFSAGGINASSFDADGHLKNPDDLAFVVEALRVRSSQ